MDQSTRPFGLFAGPFLRKPCIHDIAILAADGIGNESISIIIKIPRIINDYQLSIKTCVILLHEASRAASDRSSPHRKSGSLNPDEAIATVETSRQSKTSRSHQDYLV
jgi:hypothetical protein